MEAQQILASVKSREDVFIPQETLYGPFDVTLLVKDGIARAHKNILSQSSTFFASMLNSNMREGIEGEVRFETLSKANLGDVLDFGPLAIGCAQMGLACWWGNGSPRRRSLAGLRG